MAGDLGNLVVSITTDLSQFTQGLKSAQKQVADASKSMTIALGAVTAAFTIGIKSALNYGEEMSRLSSVTGISTETLSRLQYAAEQNETSFGALTSGLKILTRNVYDANTGNKALQQSFSSIGIAASDLRGMAIDQMLFTVADKFKTLTNDADRTALAIKVFGRSGADLIPILKLGSDGIKEFFDASDRLGNTLSGSDAKALKEFNDSIQDMQKYLRGVWVSIAKDVGPAIENFFGALQKSNILKDISNALRDVLRSVAELPGWLKLAAASAVLFGTALGRSFMVLALFPDLSRAVKFWASAMKEDLALIEKGMINLGLILSEVTHIPIEKAAELKERLAELNAEINKQRQVQVDLVSSPLNIQKMLDDLKTFQDEINNFNSSNAGQVNLGTITTTPKVDTSEFESAFDKMKTIVTSFKGSWQGWTLELQNFWKGSVTAVETTLGTAFANMMKGTQSFSDAIKQFWNSLTSAILDMIGQLIAKWLVFTALTAVFGGGGGGFWSFLGFHKGGMVMHDGGLIRAHNGMSLASDEVPIIAQTGEGILSRRGMDALGGSGVLEALNRGISRGGSPNITINVSANVASTLDIADLAEQLGGFIKRELGTV